MVIAQYAPLWSCQISDGKDRDMWIPYRTSSSPPTHTLNPPSVCLSWLSHFHLNSNLLDFTPQLIQEVP